MLLWYSGSPLSSGPHAGELLWWPKLCGLGPAGSAATLQPCRLFWKMAFALAASGGSRVLSPSSSPDEESLYYAADIPLSLMGFFFYFLIFLQKLYMRKNFFFPSSCYKQPNGIILPFLSPVSPLGDWCGVRLPRQQRQQRRLIKCLSAPSVVWQTNYQSQQSQRRHVFRNIDRQGLSGGDARGREWFPCLCLLNGGGAKWQPVVIIRPKASHFQTTASQVTSFLINYCGLYFLLLMCNICIVCMYLVWRTYFCLDDRPGYCLWWK